MNPDTFQPLNRQPDINNDPEGRPTPPPPLPHFDMPKPPLQPLQPLPMRPMPPVGPAGPEPFRTPLSQPVINVLSPYGVEYVFLTIVMFITGISLASVLLLLVNGQTSFLAMSFPAAGLVVALPVLAVLFLRLKKLELNRPELRLDASKRRSTQFTKIVAFTVCISTLIALVMSIFVKIGGDDSVSLGKAALDALCVLVVAGAPLAYYWFDEHREVR